MEFITLPEDVKIGIVGVVLAAFNFLIQFLIVRVPWLAQFVENYKEEWATALSVALIVFIETNVPTGFDDIAIAALKLVLAVLALVGFVSKFAKSRVKGFK